MEFAAAWDAVILTGGGARRLDGVAKHLLDVGGRTVLERVVEAASGASRVIVVGPPDRTPGVDAFVREHPPGGGPLAALAAGLEEIRADWVVVLAGDLPFLTADALSQLRAASPGAPVVVAVDADGRDQYLLASWSVEALRAALPPTGSRAGGAVRSLYRDVTIERVTLSGHPPPWWDCDTPTDLEQARRWVPALGAGVVGAAVGGDPRPGRVRSMTLDEWMEAAAGALGIELDGLGGDVSAVRTQLLDLARDAAHGVARPAAPLTTFLVGVAVGRGSPHGTDVDLNTYIGTVRDLIPEVDPRQESH